MTFLGLEIGSWANLVSAIATFSAVIVSLIVAFRHPAPSLTFEIREYGEKDDGQIGIFIRNFSVSPAILMPFKKSSASIDEKNSFINPLGTRNSSNFEINFSIIPIKPDKNSKKCTVIFKDTFSKRKFKVHIVKHEEVWKIK